PWESYPGVIRIRLCAFWLQTSAMRTRSASIRAPILHCGAMTVHRYLAQAQVTGHLLVHLAACHKHHYLLLAGDGVRKRSRTMMVPPANASLAISAFIDRCTMAMSPWPQRTLEVKLC